MSPGDFAKLHAAWFASTQQVGTQPSAFPHVDIGGGAFYGLGTFFRQLDAGNTFWHFGALCFAHEGISRGSYAVSWFGDWTAVALYDACIDYDAMRELDQALTSALLGPLQ